VIALKRQLKVSGFMCSYECENINEHSECNMPCILRLWERASSHISAVEVLKFFDQGLLILEEETAMYLPYVKDLYSHISLYITEVKG
jgi:hypothetical protein